jgi:hypothetical protein
MATVLFGNRFDVFFCPALPQPDAKGFSLKCIGELADCNVVLCNVCTASPSVSVSRAPRLVGDVARRESGDEGGLAGALFTGRDGRKRIEPGAALGLYDFFFASYKDTPKETLLKKSSRESSRSDSLRGW